MPLLTRMVGTPLAIDIGPGAVARLAPLLADRRISSGGHVAVVVGPGLGEEIAEIAAPAARQRRDLDASRAAASRRRRRWPSACAAGFYDALVGIGGGRTLDVAKYAATLTGLPMVAVATSLAHDGIASPVASLEEDGPQGLLRRADADRRRRRPRLRAPQRAGDAPLRHRRRDLQPVARSPTGGWPSASAARRSTALAVTFARTAAMAILHRDGRDRRRRLPRSRSPRRSCSPASRWPPPGSSRPVQRRRPRDPARDRPPLPGHGAPRRAGRRVRAVHVATCAATRTWPRAVDACLRRHGLPRLPADLGLTEAQFAEAVAHAPGTRPDRYTILEHLGARRRAEVQRACPRVRRRLRSLSCARRRSPPRSSPATAASTGRGGSTCAGSRRT